MKRSDNRLIIAVELARVLIHNSFKDIDKALDGIENAIEKIHPKEIIRCKDCRYYWLNAHCCTYYGLKGADVADRELDDFCSHAQKRAE